MVNSFQLAQERLVHHLFVLLPQTSQFLVCSLGLLLETFDLVHGIHDLRADLLLALLHLGLLLLRQDLRHLFHLLIAILFVKFLQADVEVLEECIEVLILLLLLKVQHFLLSHLLFSTILTKQLEIVFFEISPFILVRCLVIFFTVDVSDADSSQPLPSFCCHILCLFEYVDRIVITETSTFMRAQPSIVIEILSLLHDSVDKR